MTKKLRTVVGALLASTLIAACGGSMTLDAPAMPTPLVDEIDLHIGLRLSPDMYAFSHEEEVLSRETWSVDMGGANAQMFEQLFGHMFRQVTILDETDDPATLPIDAFVETSIDAFEFSIPQQTGTESYAIWIRYRLKVYNEKGDMIANWPVSAYGKSEAGGIGSSDTSLEKAAILAMRDAAALLVMKLDKETGIGALAAKPEPVKTDDDAIPATAASSGSNDAA